MNDEIKKIRAVYFIGIGGIGMSAIAKFFQSNGIRVSGYDRIETVLIKELEAEVTKLKEENQYLKEQQNGQIAQIEVKESRR